MVESTEFTSLNSGSHSAGVLAPQSQQGLSEEFDSADPVIDVIAVDQTLSFLDKAALADFDADDCAQLVEAYIKARKSLSSNVCIFDPNVKDEQGRNQLMKVATYAGLDGVELFIKNSGALDADAKDLFGLSEFDYFRGIGELDEDQATALYEYYLLKDTDAPTTSLNGEDAVLDPDDVDVIISDPDYDGPVDDFSPVEPIDVERRAELEADRRAVLESVLELAA